MTYIILYVGGHDHWLWMLYTCGYEISPSLISYEVCKFHMMSKHVW